MTLLTVEKKWYVYILLCSDGTYYTGVTTDLNRRLEEHNTSSRGAKYTKSRRPVRLIYFSEYDNRSSAQRAEYRLKKRSKQQKEQIINQSKNP